MLKIMDLSDEELRELLAQPMSDEDAETLRRVNESDHWLLAENLREMDHRDSDPDYDPANDPTCVPVTLKSDDE